MKITLMAGAAALVVAFAASGAQAGSPDGWYGAIDAGYHSLTGSGIDTKSFNNAPDGAPYGYKFSTDSDWAGFARLGYRINPNWRVELEGGYRKGDFGSIRGASTRAQPLRALQSDGHSYRGQPELRRPQRSPRRLHGHG